MPEVHGRGAEERLGHILAHSCEEPQAKLQRALRAIVEALDLRAAALCRVTRETCVAACCYPPEAASPEKSIALKKPYDSLSAEAGKIVAAVDNPLVHPFDDELGPCCMGLSLEGREGKLGTLDLFGDPGTVPLKEARRLIRLLGVWAGEALPLRCSAGHLEETRREQPNAGERLRDLREGKLRTGMLENATDGLMALAPVRDADGQVVDFEWLLANPKAAEILGRPARELIGARATKVFSVPPRMGLMRASVQVLESGEPYYNELHYEGGGKGYWLRVTVAPFGDGLAVTLHDVTSSKEVEQDLRRSEERYRLLAQNATDLIARLHPEDGYTYVSPASSSLLGYAPRRMEDFDLEQGVHPDDLARFRASYERVLATGAPGRFTYRLRHNEGHYIWVETIARGVTASDEGELIAVTRDVTERVEAEEALRSANAQLKQHNQALQDFAYVASHDLREPLRKVSAFASLLKDEYAEAVDEMGQRYMDHMSDAAARMSRLISDLLEFSRLSTTEHSFETVELTDVLREVIADLEIAIEEADATIDVGDLPALEADRTQVRQLFQNLVSNAIKFAHDDVPPAVRVRAGKARRDDGAEYCRIHVEDNGIGFDKKYRDRIFTPFRRLHGRNAFAGTGMGLAICKRIVDRHDGSITASSEAETGATFTVTLPLQQRGATRTTKELVGV